MRNLNYPKIEKIQGFIACMALKFEEMQPLSIKYFILIYSACVLKSSSKMKLEQVFNFWGREMVESIY